MEEQFKNVDNISQYMETHIKAGAKTLSADRSGDKCRAIVLDENIEGLDTSGNPFRLVPGDYLVAWGDGFGSVEGYMAQNFLGRFTVSEEPRREGASQERNSAGTQDLLLAAERMYPKTLDEEQAGKILAALEYNKKTLEVEKDGENARLLLSGKQASFKEILEEAKTAILQNICLVYGQMRSPDYDQTGLKEKYAELGRSKEMALSLEKKIALMEGTIDDALPLSGESRFDAEAMAESAKARLGDKAPSAVEAKAVLSLFKERGYSVYALEDGIFRVEDEDGKYQDTTQTYPQLLSEAARFARGSGNEQLEKSLSQAAKKFTKSELEQTEERKLKAQEGNPSLRLDRENGRIYIKTEKSVEQEVGEYARLMDYRIRREQPSQWARMADLLQGTREWREAEKHLAAIDQSAAKRNEDAILTEAHAEMCREIAKAKFFELTDYKEDAERIEGERVDWSEEAHDYATAVFGEESEENAAKVMRIEKDEDGVEHFVWQDENLSLLTEMIAAPLSNAQKGIEIDVKQMMAQDAALRKLQEDPSARPWEKNAAKEKEDAREPSNEPPVEQGAPEETENTVPDTNQRTFVDSGMHFALYGELKNNQKYYNEEFHIVPENGFDEHAAEIGIKNTNKKLFYCVETRSLYTPMNGKLIKWDNPDAHYDAVKKFAQLNQKYEKEAILQNSKDFGWHMLSPNGEKTKLSEEDWLFTQTQEGQNALQNWKYKAAMEFALNSPPVASITGKEFQKTETKNIVSAVSEFYKQVYDGKTTSPFIGEVKLNRKSVKDSLGHGALDKNKAAAYAAVPQAIERGFVYDKQENWKGRKYDTAVLVAPIAIGRKNYIMEVVLRQNRLNNSFYLHNVELKEKLRELSKTLTEQGNPQSSNLILAQHMDKVKGCSVNFSENFEPTAEEISKARALLKEKPQIELKNYSLDDGSLSQAAKDFLDRNCVPNEAGTAYELAIVPENRRLTSDELSKIESREASLEDVLERKFADEISEEFSASVRKFIKDAKERLGTELYEEDAEHLLRKEGFAVTYDLSETLAAQSAETKQKLIACQACSEDDFTPKTKNEKNIKSQNKNLKKRTVTYPDDPGSEDVYEFNENRKLTHTKHPTGEEGWHEFDPDGNETRYRDTKGNEHIYEYDDNGNLAHVRKNNGHESWNDYDSENRRIHSRTNNGDEQWWEYDKDGNLTHYRNDQGDEIWHEYDKRGNKIRTKTNSFEEATYDYDESGNLVHTKNSNGTEEWREYGANNKCVHAKDSLGKEQWFEYDDHGNKTYAKIAAPGEADYEAWRTFDERGNMLTARDTTGFAAIHENEYHDGLITKGKEDIMNEKDKELKDAYKNLDVSESIAIDLASSKAVLSMLDEEAGRLGKTIKVNAIREDYRPLNDGPELLYALVECEGLDQDELVKIFNGKELKTDGRDFPLIPFVTTPSGSGTAQEVINKTENERKALCVEAIEERYPKALAALGLDKGNLEYAYKEAAKSIFPDADDVWEHAIDLAAQKRCEKKFNGIEQHDGFMDFVLESSEVLFDAADLVENGELEPEKIFDELDSLAEEFHEGAAKEARFPNILFAENFDDKNVKGNEQLLEALDDIAVDLGVGLTINGVKDYIPLDGDGTKKHVLVEYECDELPEDSLFNELKERDIWSGDLEIDANPITPGKSGTIDEYIERIEGFKKEDRAKALAQEIGTKRAGEIAKKIYADMTSDHDREYAESLAQYTNLSGSEIEWLEGKLPEDAVEGARLVEMASALADNMLESYGDSFDMAMESLGVSESERWTLVKKEMEKDGKSRRALDGAETAWSEPLAKSVAEILRIEVTSAKTWLSHEFERNKDATAHDAIKHMALRGLWDISRESEWSAIQVMNESGMFEEELVEGLLESARLVSEGRMAAGKALENARDDARMYRMYTSSVKEATQKSLSETGHVDTGRLDELLSEYKAFKKIRDVFGVRALVDRELMAEAEKRVADRYGRLDIGDVEGLSKGEYLARQTAVILMQRQYASHEAALKYDPEKDERQVLDRIADEMIEDEIFTRNGLEERLGVNDFRSLEALGKKYGTEKAQALIDAARDAGGAFRVNDGELEFNFEIADAKNTWKKADVPDIARKTAELMREDGLDERQPETYRLLQGIASESLSLEQRLDWKYFTEKDFEAMKDRLDTIHEGEPEYCGAVYAGLMDFEIKVNRNEDGSLSCYFDGYYPETDTSKEVSDIDCYGYHGKSNALPYYEIDPDASIDISGIEGMTYAEFQKRVQDAVKGSIDIFKRKAEGHTLGLDSGELERLLSSDKDWNDLLHEFEQKELSKFTDRIMDAQKKGLDPIEQTAKSLLGKDDLSEAELDSTRRRIGDLAESLAGAYCSGEFPEMPAGSAEMFAAVSDALRKTKDYAFLAAANGKEELFLALGKRTNLNDAFNEKIESLGPESAPLLKQAVATYRECVRKGKSGRLQDSGLMWSIPLTAAYSGKKEIIDAVLGQMTREELWKFFDMGTWNQIQKTYSNMLIDRADKDQAEKRISDAQKALRYYAEKCRYLKTLESTAAECGNASITRAIAAKGDFEKILERLLEGHEASISLTADSVARELWRNGTIVCQIGGEFYTAKKDGTAYEPLDMQKTLREFVSAGPGADATALEKDIYENAKNDIIRHADLGDFFPLSAGRLSPDEAKVVNRLAELLENDWISVDEEGYVRYDGFAEPRRPTKLLDDLYDAVYENESVTLDMLSEAELATWKNLLSKLEKEDSREQKKLEKEQGLSKHKEDWSQFSEEVFEKMKSDLEAGCDHDVAGQLRKGLVRTEILYETVDGKPRITLQAYYPTNFENEPDEQGGRHFLLPLGKKFLGTLEGEELENALENFDAFKSHVENENERLLAAARDEILRNESIDIVAASENTADSWDTLEEAIINDKLETIENDLRRYRKNIGTTQGWKDAWRLLESSGEFEGDEDYTRKGYESLVRMQLDDLAEIGDLMGRQGLVAARIGGFCAAEDDAVKKMSAKCLTHGFKDTAEATWNRAGLDPNDPNDPFVEKEIVSMVGQHWSDEEIMDALRNARKALPSNRMGLDGAVAEKAIEEGRLTLLSSVMKEMASEKDPQAGDMLFDWLKKFKTWENFEAKVSAACKTNDLPDDIRKTAEQCGFAFESWNADGITEYIEKAMDYGDTKRLSHAIDIAMISGRAEQIGLYHKLPLEAAKNLNDESLKTIFSRMSGEELSIFFDEKGGWNEILKETVPLVNRSKTFGVVQDYAQMCGFLKPLSKASMMSHIIHYAPLDIYESNRQEALETFAEKLEKILPGADARKAAETIADAMQKDHKDLYLIKDNLFVVDRIYDKDGFKKVDEKSLAEEFVRGKTVNIARGADIETADAIEAALDGKLEKTKEPKTALDKVVSFMQKEIKEKKIPLRPTEENLKKVMVAVAKAEGTLSENEKKELEKELKSLGCKSPKTSLNFFARMAGMQKERKHDRWPSKDGGTEQGM